MPPTTKPTKPTGRPAKGQQPVGKTPPRSIRVSDAQWDRWRLAAEAAGYDSRTEWLIAIADAEADEALN